MPGVKGSSRPASEHFGVERGQRAQPPAPSGHDAWVCKGLRAPVGWLWRPCTTVPVNFARFCSPLLHGR